MTRLPSRIDAELETVARDLGRLVLTIVELLRSPSTASGTRSASMTRPAPVGYPWKASLGPQWPRRVGFEPTGPVAARWHHRRPDRTRHWGHTSNRGRTDRVNEAGIEGRDTSGPTTDEAMTRSEERLRVGDRAARDRAGPAAQAHRHRERLDHRAGLPRGGHPQREPITDANRDQAPPAPPSPKRSTRSPSRGAPRRRDRRRRARQARQGHTHRTGDRQRRGPQGTYSCTRSPSACPPRHRNPPDPVRSGPPTRAHLHTSTTPPRRQERAHKGRRQDVSTRADGLNRKLDWWQVIKSGRGYVVQRL